MWTNFCGCRLLSVEITFEAFERIWDGAKPKRLGELFIVSTLGLVVNLVGMMAFGHHHHGGHDHDHDHDHGHSHGHGHDHSHGHNHNHSHNHSHSQNYNNHDHGNENMRGIYLHVLADTLGSFSVIVSTALTHFTGWSFWDPLASCFIAGLIFVSSCPLIMSCSRRLILSIPHSAEYSLRNTLAGIMDQKGVVGYAVPKFWVDDRSDAAIAAAKDQSDCLVDHHHGYDHDHDHDRDKCGFSHDHFRHDHHNHDDNHPHEAKASPEKSRLHGVVHVLAHRLAFLDDVRDRVADFLRREGVDAVVQVEREGDNTCWCGVGRTPGMAPSPLAKAL